MYSVFSIFSILTVISGRTPASSHASRLLSTASLTDVINALVSESKPSICLFFSKNSETEISFCFFASSWAIDSNRSSPR